MRSLDSQETGWLVGRNSGAEVLCTALVERSYCAEVLCTALVGELREQ